MTRSVTVPVTVEDIFRDHGGRMYNYALRVTRCREDAEDAVQDAFVRIKKHLHRHRGEVPVEAFIWTIHRNCCLRVMERRVRWSRAKEPRLWEEPPDQRPDCLATDRALAERFLQSLEEPKRSLVVLVAMQQKTLDDAAELLGLNKSTARCWYYRSLRELKKKFDHDDPEERSL